ncbi:uncharacterized protein LOC125774934 [Anopheles funestus]|uniref:uncharacterized protein LOC125774934 n=1 Tax=Anopheles funestus TaxID=62324 RepID=UPI0020C7452E|nr:uncharacterized protein LOC125774934 [Anopheles funestus]
MDKKIKAAQLKRRIAVENISALERFQAQFSGDDAKQIPEALEDLERHKEGFFAAVSKLEELDDSNEAIEACIMERINIEERCRKLKSFLRDNLRREEGALNDTSALASPTLAFGRPNAPHLRLPKIELPSFDGDQTKWLSFRDRFIAMIDASPELPSIAKLEYLLSALKGEAALPFEHTQLTADNYSVTWAALLKRYDNPRLLVREYYRKLHYLPAVQSESVEKLTCLVDEFSRYVNGFVKLNEPVDSWDTPLSNMLLMKLDRATLLAWEKHSVHFPKDRYKEVIAFVQDRIQILKSTNNFTSDTNDSASKVAGTFRSSASRRSIAQAASSRPFPPSAPTHKCPLQCVDSHLLRSCPVFTGKDVNQRREIVSSKHLCWNCLSDSHQVKACKSDYACRTCRQRHHTLLHVPASSTVAMTLQDNAGMVFLETALLNIVDDYGVRHEARALLDSGSMSNFISESLARKMLGTPRNKVKVSVTSIGNNVQLVKGSIFASVESRSHAHASQLELLVVDTPFLHIPTASIDASSWKIPDLPLADPSFYEPGKIDIIIGGDTYWELHSGRKRSLGKGKPWLVETPFGWVVAGNVSPGASHESRLCHLSTSSSSSMDSIMERFWEIETISDDPAVSAEEDACEKHFVATTTRDASGRYVVRLPQNTNPSIVLGVSKAIADRRLLAVERRLRSNPTMKEEYSSFMKEYERLGHMKRLTGPVDDSCEHYYLPHHAVVKETSTTTKVRVVFDASCKSSSGYSLNDKLLVGPVIQDDLFTIIVRFRSRAIALSADVEKMYRQIRHDDDDHRYLRIRYREDPTQPIQTFELQTVTYGTASAPFLATRTLKQIAYDHQTLYPRAVNAVIHDFYVDDLLTGTEEVLDAIEMRKQISEMLNSAGFSLKKWASNMPEALKGVPPGDLANHSTHEWKDPQSVSTLGLVWEPAVDMLRFRIDLPPAVTCLRSSKSSERASNLSQMPIPELITLVPPLTKDELEQAELRLCHLAQQDSFSGDIIELANGRELPRSSRLKWLAPFIDPMGILRVGGRLRHAQMEVSSKHPILLSSKHQLAVLVAVAHHHKYLHAGPELLLSTLRQRFWIIGGRNLAKAVFHRCHQCFKAKPTLVKQSVADLPASRVSPTRPFLVSGIDYCGPIYLKSTVRNRSPTKAYIAIFVCFSTRALHIELVSDLTTAAFLAALRRFVARRGKIAELHSDNATTFKGAAHELHRIYQMLKCSDRERNEIFNWCANDEIQWKFIPPRAPHFGGLWEAAVRSAKQHIVRTLGVAGELIKG